MTTFATLSEAEPLLRRALDTWGARSQVQMVFEETAELIIALCHHERGRIHATALADEVADVLVVVAQLRLLLGERMVDDAVTRKLARLAERLEVR